MALLIVFLALLFFMFQVGYQWRKLEEEMRNKRAQEAAEGVTLDTLFDSMAQKI